MARAGVGTFNNNFQVAEDIRLLGAVPEEEDEGEVQPPPCPQCLVEFPLPVPRAQQRRATGEKVCCVDGSVACSGADCADCAWYVATGS